MATTERFRARLGRDEVPGEGMVKPKKWLRTLKDDISIIFLVTELELELELTQSHMTQKSMLRKRASSK